MAVWLWCPWLLAKVSSDESKVPIFFCLKTGAKTSQNQMKIWSNRTNDKTFTFIFVSLDIHFDINWPIPTAWELRSWLITGIDNSIWAKEGSPRKVLQHLAVNADEHNQRANKEIHYQLMSGQKPISIGAIKTERIGQLWFFRSRSKPRDYST